MANFVSTFRNALTQQSIDMHSEADSWLEAKDDARARLIGMGWVWIATTEDVESDEIDEINVDFRIGHLDLYQVYL